MRKDININKKHIIKKNRKYYIAGIIILLIGIGAYSGHKLYYKMKIKNYLNINFSKLVIKYNDELKVQNLNSLEEKILFLKYKKIPDGFIKTSLDISSEKYTGIMDKMYSAGLIKNKKVQILFLDDSKIESIKSSVKTFSEETAEMISDQTEFITGYYKKFGFAKHLNFQKTAPFFYGYSIFQHNQLRNFMKYHFKINESEIDSKFSYILSSENLDNLIIEKSVKQYGKFIWSVYSTSSDSPNFITADKEFLREYFWMGKNDTEEKFKEFASNLLYRKYMKDSFDLGINISKGFSKLNVISDDEIALPIVEFKENEILNELSLRMLDRLLRIIKIRDKEIKAVYSKNFTSEEIDYEDFFVLWFKFLEREVLSELVKMGKLDSEPVNYHFMTVYY